MIVGGMLLVENLAHARLARQLGKFADIDLYSLDIAGQF